jgi:thiosulfate/3-mercaptopyruvate sulfurtransferase
MSSRNVEMGENFTGVKNEKLTRLAGLFFAAVAVAAAAGLALIQPQELAPSIAGRAILYTGPNVLFRSKHIPGAVYAGPGSNADGLALLKREGGKLAHDREIVIYCGCCPWDRCPNIAPAMAVLKEMGFTKVKALYLGTGFKADWIDKGYPTD